MTKTLQDRLRDGLVVSPYGFSDLGGTVELMEEAADALAALEAERDRLREIEAAARAYFNDYLQDEAEDKRLCVDEWQWDAIRRLAAALKETDT